MKYLLDVNALIAAIWTDHAHHPAVDAWIKGMKLASLDHAISHPAAAVIA
ncbi:MAG TPA: hypothetical protein P5186_14125 [Candidatus Paceibacterota bacterium]|nr:hypothetical protein [Verrucomicrobiota bacterium]HRY49182.1 hypothetical protein [Candidatus Paceibacterota bacterium]